MASSSGGNLVGTQVPSWLPAAEPLITWPIKQKKISLHTWNKKHFCIQTVIKCIVERRHWSASCNPRKYSAGVLYAKATCDPAVKEYHQSPQLTLIKQCLSCLVEVTYSSTHEGDYSGGKVKKGFCCSWTENPKVVVSPQKTSRVHP